MAKLLDPLNIWGKLRKQPDPEELITPEKRRATAFIEQLYQKPTPSFPTAPVAGLSDLQKKAGAMTEEYAGRGVEGADYLRSILAESGDITEIPEYKAILSKVFEQGNLMTNRLGRSLQMRGGMPSSTGRNILGRSVEETQAGAVSALAPYAAQEKGRKVSAAESLAGLSETATLNRLNALSTQGALERQLEQLRQSAEYEKMMRELNYPVDVQAKLAMGLLGLPTEWTQEPSLMEQLAPLIQAGGQAAMAMAMGGGGGGGGGVSSTGTSAPIGTSGYGNWGAG